MPGVFGLATSEPRWTVVEDEVEDKLSLLDDWLALVIEIGAPRLQPHLTAQTTNPDRDKYSKHELLLSLPSVQTADISLLPIHSLARIGSVASTRQWPSLIPHAFEATAFERVLDCTYSFPILGCEKRPPTTI